MIISEYFKVIQGSVADKKLLEKYNIDVIVNAANPTLMGSGQGVDGAIHSAIDKELQDSGQTFRQKIREELNDNGPENRIRCQRGGAIVTEGYGLCKYVIHTVGPQNDGINFINGKEKRKPCSSSRINTLEGCYYQIIEQIKEHSDMENIVVPIIGSGEYRMPYSDAVRIAITSMGNALIEWQRKDPELFAISQLKKIYFCIFDLDAEKQAEKYEEARRKWEEYRPLFEKNKRAVFQKTVTAHRRYWYELVRYDEQRGYFAIAKGVRQVVHLLRWLFFPMMLLKDLLGKWDWEKRRAIVEFIAMVKIFIPILAGILMHVLFVKNSLPGEGFWEGALSYLIIYLMVDTVTYLLSLILLADIQRPSANIIRSLTLLFVNYLEVSLDMAFLYSRLKGVSFGSAAEKVFLGLSGKEAAAQGIYEKIFQYCDAGIKFFFLSIAFGYFANHIQQRKFRS